MATFSRRLKLSALIQGDKRARRCHAVADPGPDLVYRASSVGRRRGLSAEAWPRKDAPIAYIYSSGVLREEYRAPDKFTGRDAPSHVAQRTPWAGRWEMPGPVDHQMAPVSRVTRR